MSNKDTLKNKAASNRAEERRLRRSVEETLGPDASYRLKRIEEGFSLALQIRSATLALSLPQKHRRGKLAAHQDAFGQFVIYLCDRNAERDSGVSDVEILKDAVARTEAYMATVGHEQDSDTFQSIPSG